MLTGAGQWTVRRRQQGLDPWATHQATRTVVDWFAATVAGAAMEPCPRLRSAVGAERSTGRAGLVPSGERVGVRDAALVNGTAAHAAELDDIFRDGLYHPGAPTVAAALAVGQDQGCSGADLLLAVALGVEVSTRVAATLQPQHYRFWHTTGTVGPVGAAVAASTLLGADAAAVAHASATAVTMGAGLQQAFRSDSMSKPLHSGRAAEAGVLSAQLAAEGVTGALDVLDGPAGLGAATAGDPDWSRTFLDLDDVQHIGGLSIKTHACCGHTFAAVDATLELRAEHSVDPEAVDAVEVATYGTALAVTGNPNPQSASEARFSLAYCVAAALVQGEVGLGSFAPEQLASPRLRALSSRVSLSVDPELEAAFPQRRGAAVVLRMRDGRVLERTAATRRGDPDAPLSDDDLRAKFDTCVRPVFGTSRCAEMARRLWALPDTADISALLEFGGTR